MKKQELIHLHELCVELRLFFEEQDEVPPNACSHYNALDINPVAINQSKGAHREAVQTLLADLTTSLGEHADEKMDSVDSKQTATNA